MNNKLQNKGGYYVLEKAQKKQTKQTKQPKQTQTQKKTFKPFEGKGIKMGNDKNHYNWICQQCGFINQEKIDICCKNCQFQK
ncbi:unnamed protein product [Paramecium pentaurelia]|uniref:Uncharacterized protein n=1 Tax=Paramecium pentaurelia TaxID=43138 RepID=A0A8S1TRB7_9CILI|nr:unnamed protein product [Paramecium pentaurelia]